MKLSHRSTRLQRSYETDGMKLILVACFQPLLLPPFPSCPHSQNSTLRFRFCSPPQGLRGKLWVSDLKRRVLVCSKLGSDSALFTFRQHDLICDPETRHLWTRMNFSERLPCPGAPRKLDSFLPREEADVVLSLTFFLGGGGGKKTQPSVARETCPPFLGLVFMTGKKGHCWNSQRA